jgi:hypothetical protein
MGAGVFAPRVNRPGREADHLPPSDAKVKNECSYTPNPHISFHGVYSALMQYFWTGIPRIEIIFGAVTEVRVKGTLEV